MKFNRLNEMAGNESKFGLERQLHSQFSKDVATKGDLSNSLPITRLSAPTSTDTVTISDLSYALKADEFQLGDELFVYDPSDLYRQNNSDLYLICSGRVRVLCAGSDREVTASVLEIGETFGADHLFRETLLSYRAIAASSCQIARISLPKLTNLLDHLPQLRAQLFIQVQQREYLIFFKTLPQCRSLPNRQLQQHILSELVEQRVRAGEFLAQAIADDTGYFWLRSGRIQSQGDISQPPRIGDCWGYPEPIPADWIAQTDLLLYKRPLNSWETAKLLNLL